MSELRDLRFDHLEEEVREIKTVLGRPEPLIKAAEAAPPRPGARRVGSGARSAAAYSRRPDRGQTPRVKPGEAVSQIPRTRAPPRCYYRRSRRPSDSLRLRRRPNAQKDGMV